MKDKKVMAHIDLVQLQKDLGESYEAGYKAGVEFKLKNWFNYEALAFAEWIGIRGYKFIDNVAVWELNEQESDSTLSLFNEFIAEYHPQSPVK